MDIASLARRLGKLTTDNSPTILTSVGVVGAITTAYLAAKASFNVGGVVASRNIEASEEIDVIETPRDVVQFIHKSGLWKQYIPAATVGAATIICIIGANSINGRRAAGLAAAMTIVEKTAEEYKDKVVEKLGARKEEALRDELIQDRVNETYVDNVKIFGAEAGQLCVDKFSLQYFRSTVEDIHKAVNALNYALIHDGYASLSEYYRLLGIEAPSYSENIGWNSDRLLEIRVASVLANDIPCIAVEFKNEPHPDYGRFHR